MSRRIDRIVELAARLAESRAEVAKLEAELEGMLGPDEPAPKPARPEANGTGNGHHGRSPSPLRGQVVELAKAGLAAAEIAVKLGLKGNAGRIQVANHLFRARKSGELPKAEASR